MTTNLGRIVPKYRGEYRQTEIYFKLDIVTYKNRVYICTSHNINEPPTNNSNHWQLLVTGMDEERITQMKNEIKNELRNEMLQWK